MIPRFFISLAAKLLLDLPLMLCGYIIFPIAYWLRRTNNEITHFPAWAWVWDNSKYGIDGGGFWAERTIGQPYWWRCFVWTIVRNPTYNWCRHVLGISGRSYAIVGDDIDVGPAANAGKYWLQTKDGLFWEFYLIKPYPLFGVKRCVRFRFGWKLRGKTAADICPMVFVINPFMPYTGTKI